MEKNSLGKTKDTNSPGKQLNLRLARAQVLFFETAANLCASRRQTNYFFAIFFFFFFEFCFPSDLNVPLGYTLGNMQGFGKTKHSGSLGASEQVLIVYIYICLRFTRTGNYPGKFMNCRNLGRCLQKVKTKT